MRNTENLIVGGGCFTVILTLIVQLALFIGVIYVAWHFISKYW